MQVNSDGKGRFSLGGSSLLALEHFIAIHPAVSTIIVATDNDAAGEQVAARAALIPGLQIQRALPLNGKDWNDTLCAVIADHSLTGRDKSAISC